MSHLRLVHPRRPILTRDQLAQFQTPKTWAEIVKLEPRMTVARWREAIMDADSEGFGLLMWIRGVVAKGDASRKARCGYWMLTTKGREYVGLARGIRPCSTDDAHRLRSF